MQYDTARKYYVYAWKIKETDEVFYVGKGCGNRYKTWKRENSYFMKIYNTHECVSEILLDNLTEAEAFEYEKIMIAFYRSVSPRMVNVLDGGEQPPKATGLKRSEATKKKMRLASKKRYENNPKLSIEASQKLKKFLETPEGKIFQQKSIAARSTDEFKKQQSVRSKAANRTPEYIEKQSEIVKKMWESDAYRDAHSGERNVRSQSVDQYDNEGNFIRSFKTITEAYQVTGVNYSKISAVCRGERKTAGGFVWKYPNGIYKPIKGIRKNSYKPENDISAKAVLKCDLMGNVLEEFYSTSEAARNTPGADRSGIIANLRGRTKKAYGFIWKYK